LKSESLKKLIRVVPGNLPSLGLLRRHTFQNYKFSLAQQGHCSYYIVLLLGVACVPVSQNFLEQKVEILFEKALKQLDFIACGLI
jgi:hypothetical protein